MSRQADDVPGDGNDGDGDAAPASDQAAGSGSTPGAEEPEHTENTVFPEPETNPINPYGTPGNRFSRTPFTWGLFAGLGVLLAYLLYIGFQQTAGVLMQILIAGFLAIGINPMVERVQRLKLPRPLAVVVVCFGIFIVLCGGVVALIPPLITEVTAFAEELPTYVENLKNNQWINDLNEQYQIIESIKGALTGENIANAAGGILSVVSTAFGTLFNGVVIGILTVYFLFAFDRLKAGAYRLLPASRRPRAQALGDEILAKVGNYTLGALGIAAIAGISSYIFMVIVGVPYAYALALVVAVFDLIPQVGATVGAVIVSLVGFSVSIPVGIACVVFFVLYQQLENWIIYPQMMRRSVKVSDLAAIIGLLIGAALFGVVGALLAVPAVATVQLLVREVHIPRQDLS